MNKEEFHTIANKISTYFSEMDKVNDDFSKKSNIKCVSTCGGQCCLNKNIEINPVELLPLIIELSDSGELFKFYEISKNNQESHCIFFQNGKCSIYKNRSVLCRLFGYSSTYNKNKEKVMSICSLIKNEQNIDLTSEVINSSANLIDYSSLIASLLPDWNNAPVQINKAFIYATERFLSSTQYE